MKLRTKLMLIFLLLSIIPMIVVGYMAYHHGERTLKQNKFDDLMSLNALKADEINKWAHDQQETMKEIANVSWIKEYATVLTSSDPAQPEYIAAAKFLKESFSATTLGFTGFSLLRASDGLTVFSTNGKEEGGNRRTYPYFEQGKQAAVIQSIGVGDIYSSPTFELPALIIGTPVNDMKGNLIGVLAGYLDFSELSNIVAQTGGLSQTKDTYLVDGNSIFITTPRLGKEYMANKAPRAEGEIKPLTSQWDDFGSYGSYENYRGVAVIGACQWLPEWGWYIQSEVDQAEALKPIHDLRTIVLIIGGIVAAFVAVLALFFSRTITRPVRRLAEGAGVIGSGNLDFKVGTAAKDEIGELSRSFDRMVGNLKETTVSRDALNKESAELKRTHENLLKEKNFSELAINSLPGVFYLFAKDGKFLRWNRNFEEVSGYSSQEMSAIGPLDVIDPEDQGIAAEAIGRVFAEGKADVEAKILSKNGDKTLYYFTGLRMIADGAPYCVGAGIDITERNRAEEALRESEEWFSTSFHRSPIAMTVASFPEGRCVDVNDSFLRMLEYTREEVIGHISSEMNMYADPDERAQMSRVFSEEGRVKKYEMTARTKTGKLLTVLSSSERLRIRGQDHVISMTIDITERKRAEETLKKKEAFLAEAQRMAHLGNWEWDIVTKEIVWSDEVYRIHGFQPQEFKMTLRTLMDLVHPDDREFMEGSINGALHQGKPYNVDRRLLLPNGEVRTVHEEGEFSFGKSGKPVHASGTVQDITERKRIEEKLAESERLYSSMANSSPVGVYIIQDGKFTFANQSFCDLTGFSRNELSDMEPWSLVHPKDREMVRANAVRMLKGQSGASYEYRAIIKNGETRVILETVASMQYLGKRATLGNYMDITERKQMEEKLQQYSEKLEEMVEERTRELKDAQADLVRSERLAMLGQFSGSISHELRNPLGVIDSSAYYLKTKLEGADEKVALHLDRIKSAAGKANAIIQSILELTRMHAPKMERLDINAVISGAIATVDVPAKVNLMQNYSEPEIWINGDLEQLLIAFQNIIKNAVEAMEGAGTLTVTVRTTIDGQVEISIGDSGMGIAPENLEKIFEPLFSTKAKGIGLGLAITRMVIEKNRGIIEVKSELGKGTTFIVRLPRSIGGKQ